MANIKQIQPMGDATIYDLSVRYMRSPDTRSATINPNDLNANENGIQFDFKQKSISGLSANYSGIMSYRPYSQNSDWTGGPAHQLAFDENGLHWRKSTGDTTWQAWQDIVRNTGTWGISITGNAATATKLATARTISLTGSVTGSASFDGSGNISISTSTNHSHSYLPLSGGTMTGAAVGKSTASSWIDGQRYTRGGWNQTDATDTGSYWPWMRQTNTSSAKWFSIGTLNNSLYIIGSKTSRTDNGYDYGWRFDLSNGYLYGNFSGTLSGNCTGSAGSVAWGNVTGKPSTFAPSSHTHNYAGSPSAGGDANNARGVRTYGNDVQLGTANSSTNDSGDIVFLYGNGAEKSRIWTDNTYSSGIGPNYRVYNSSGTCLRSSRLWVMGESITGAVWNDYAECRTATSIEPGYVWIEKGDDTLIKSSKRLQPFAGVSSDTWGFSEGETETAKTHIAVAGRVLVYPYKNRNKYKPGMCVCTASNGTVDIMHWWEEILFPSRIVGTVSCVPEYKEWGGGELADRKPVKVDGRIWIKVR